MSDNEESRIIQIFVDKIDEMKSEANRTISEVKKEADKTIDIIRKKYNRLFLSTIVSIVTVMIIGAGAFAKINIYTDKVDEYISLYRDVKEEIKDVESRSDGKVTKLQIDVSNAGIHVTQ